jgi:hypothetical protein
LRSASSSVTRGSTVSWCFLPLTVSVIGTGPGPTGAAPEVCASALPPITPAATLVAPTVFRKARLLTLTVLSSGGPPVS